MWELELPLLVDADFGHGSFDLSWMPESHFVTALRGNKKSANAIVFSNVVLLQLA